MIRNIIVIFIAMMAAIGTATLFAMYIESLPKIFILFAIYVVAGMIAVPATWIGVVHCLGGIRGR